MLALVSCSAVAQLLDENVLLPLPSGYRIGYENKTPRALIVEMVKAGETVENWTELLTSQTFYNPAARTPALFKAAADQAGTRFCPGFESRVFDEDPENGYPAVAWISDCANNPATSKPEWTFFKAIRGKDALYVVHKAFRFEPNNQQIKEASMYLKGVSACDTRTPEHPCPTMTQPSR